MAAPPKYIYTYEKRTGLVKPSNDGAYIRGSAVGNSEFLWKNSGEKRREQVVWKRATRKQVNPEYLAYKNAINTNLAKHANRALSLGPPEVPSKGWPALQKQLGIVPPGNDAPANNTMNDLVSRLGNIGMSGKGRRKTRRSKRAHHSRRKSRRN